MNVEGGFFMLTNKIVKRYEKIDYDRVMEFINRVQKVETVNLPVIEQSILIKDENQVWGMVSFEEFEKIGVIRYFIYEQQVAPDLLVNMFFELYHSAKEKGVNQLVAVAPHPYVSQLFSLLGFIEGKKSIPVEIPGLVNSDDSQLMMIKL